MAWPRYAAHATGPQQILLSGLIRDFQDMFAPGGHPDFESPNFNPGPKKYVAFLVEPILGSDGNPVLATPDGTGQVVVTQWMDNLGRNISHTTYNAGLGDTAGQLGITTDVVIESELTFNDWYNDVLGVNMSMWLPIVVNLQADGTYVFDSAVDEPYASKGGFFPIDNQLYGTAGTVYNPGRPQGGGADRNFHFTFEGHWKFPYDASADHFFSFTGDDDVWVFIDGKLVIDLGGRHNPREQTVELNRLGLTDGELYDMAFFYAERHCCQSNIRIQTNLVLVPDPPPTITGSHD
jgi:fibro-slime domain-containing protein